MPSLSRLGVALLAAGVSITVLGPTPAASAAAGPDRPSRATSWFKDPYTKVQRSRLVSVPAHPAAGDSRRAIGTYTKALHRTAENRVAVPAGWARGRQLVKGQAVVTPVRFKAGSSTLDAAARRAVADLRRSTQLVGGLRCEGYTDYVATRPKPGSALARARAAAVCNALDNGRAHVTTTAVGVGATRPVVVGPHRRRGYDPRVLNRRVIVAVTADKAPAAVAPGAPVLNYVVANPAGFGVNFNAPARAGSSTVTGYDYTLDNGATWHTLHHIGFGPVFDGSVTGLTNGTTYTLKVRAVSAAGVSPVSNALAVTPRDVPAKVDLGDGLGERDGLLRAFFAEPADNGSPITGYEYTTDGGTTWQSLDWDCDADDCAGDVAGLANGTEYAVAVRAVNAIGNGEASDAVTGTPHTTPGAPDLTRVTAGDGQASLSFAGPTDDGGDEVDGFEVSTDGGTTWNELTYAGSGPFTATLTGLTNAQTYSVLVRAVNGAGAGTASAAVDVTPSAVAPAGAPSISGSHSDMGNDVHFTLTPPTSDGGSPVTGYEYSVDGGAWTAIPANALNEWQPGQYDVVVHTSTSFWQGTHTFKVRAVNAAGPGAESNQENVFAF